MTKVFSKIKRFFKWLFFGDHKLTLGRIPISLKGQKWELHPFDDDPYPSVPHLHSVEDPRIKIDIYTGEVYDDGINIGKLKPKEFNSLWHNDIFIKLVNKARTYYADKYPNYKLLPLPFLKQDIDVNIIIKSKTNNCLEINYKEEK